MTSAPDASATGPPAPSVALDLVGRFTVSVLGRPLAEQDVGTRKARSLLKVLAVRHPATTPTDLLVSALWAQHPPRDPEGNLATLVSRLRTSLGAAAIVGDRRGWSLAPHVTVDVRRSVALVDEARWRSLDAPALSRSAAESALALLGDGRILLDEPDLPDWAEPAQADALRVLREARHLAGWGALAMDEPQAALLLAEAAWVDDVFDEDAVRLLMTASHAAGHASRGLMAYARLREVLADELGSDPAEYTQGVHLGLLGAGPVRENAAGPRVGTLPRRAGADPRPEVAAPDLLVGRTPERHRLTELWAEAVDGRPALVLVCGEGGIGKSVLAADLAAVVRSTGGLVLDARCFEAERSLFLQPVLDAVRPELLRSPPDRLRGLAGDRLPSLARMVPELVGLVGPVAGDLSPPDIERRLAYEAIVGVLRRLSHGQPLLLLLDDLHHAGLATVEFLHLLVRQAAPARVLVLATLRTEEGATALRALGPLAHRLDLSLLDGDDVAALAEAYGRPDLGPGILARTRGHPLFVIESLRSVVAGDDGVPATLTATVAARLDRAEAEDQGVLRAASVLGTAFDPVALADLVAAEGLAVVQACERLAEARLLARAGTGYEFVNDLVQEAVYASTSAPLRATYHRRATDVFRSSPEVAAGHHAALDEWAEAATAWVRAGELATHVYAVADAEHLFGRAVEAAQRAGDDELLALARLQRGRARVGLQELPSAFGDLTEALALSQSAGARALEVQAQRELAGDVLIGLGRPLSACEPHLEGGLRVARQIGDTSSEVDLLARSAVLATNRLQLDRALTQGLRAVSLARARGDEPTLVLALDGLKSVYAYAGDLTHLSEVVEELEPLCWANNSLYLLQWCILERSFIPLAAGRWDEARALVLEALELNRRCGWTSYAAGFAAHLSWIARLSGDVDEAVTLARSAVDLGDGLKHSWWDAFACAMLASALTAAGSARPGSVEVRRILQRGLASADRSGAEAYRLRCLAALAETTGSPDVLAQADLLVRGIGLPRGWAWLHGVDAYLSLTRAWTAAGNPGRAAEVLSSVTTPGHVHGWDAVLEASGAPTLTARLAAVTVPRQRSSASRPAARAAPSPDTGR